MTSSPQIVKRWPTFSGGIGRKALIQMEIAGTALTYEEAVTLVREHKSQSKEYPFVRWIAAVSKVREILGDVEPLSIICRDEVTVQIRHKEFLRMFVGRPCMKEVAGGGEWVHWSHKTDGVKFTSCERVAVVSTCEVLVTHEH